MKQLKQITEHFSQYAWFLRAEQTSYPKEFMLFADKYPYSEDHVIFDYEKTNKVRLRIQALQ